MLVGRRIKEARMKKGLSQQQLGDMLDVSKVSICGYETGTRTPAMETFLNLIQILDLPVEYALGMETFIVNEKDEPYGYKIAQEDLSILEELKKHRELYNELVNNPKRTVDKIVSKMKK